MSVRSVLEQSGRAALCGPRLMVVAAAVGARRRSTEHEDVGACRRSTPLQQQHNTKESRRSTRRCQSPPTQWWLNCGRYHTSLSPRLPSDPLSRPTLTQCFSGPAHEDYYTVFHVLASGPLGRPT
jgi:hypothetical protein